MLVCLWFCQCVSLSSVCPPVTVSVVSVCVCVFGSLTVGVAVGVLLSLCVCVCGRLEGFGVLGSVRRCATVNVLVCVCVLLLVC